MVPFVCIFCGARIPQLCRQAPASYARTSLTNHTQGLCCGCLVRNVSMPPLVRAKDHIPTPGSLCQEHSFLCLLQATTTQPPPTHTHSHAHIQATCSADRGATGSCILLSFLRHTTLESRNACQLEALQLAGCEGLLQAADCRRLPSGGGDTRLTFR